VGGSFHHRTGDSWIRKNPAESEVLRLQLRRLETGSKKPGSSVTPLIFARNRWCSGGKCHRNSQNLSPKRSFPMSRFKPALIAIVLTILTFAFSSLTFAKQPPKSPLPPRPKPGHGRSQVANPTLLSGVNEVGTSSGITITHGGNPPRSGDGFTITHGGNPPRSPEPNDYCQAHAPESCHRHDCDRDVHSCYEETFEPLHSTCMVLPGDTFETVSLREYRTNSKARSIASLNKLSLNAALIPGQTIMLP
jgi:hypothetical protein